MLGWVRSKFSPTKPRPKEIKSTSLDLPRPPSPEIVYGSEEEEKVLKGYKYARFEDLNDPFLITELAVLPLDSMGILLERTNRDN